MLKKNLKKDATPKKPERKPDNVSIVGNLSTIASPTPMGSLMLFINALGDDNVVYQWDGPSKSWRVQG